MRNGIYTASKDNDTPHVLIAVCDDLANEYEISWYGDLALWEIWRNGHEPVDVSEYDEDDYLQMVSDIINVGWNEIYAEFIEYDFDHLPEGRDEMNALLHWWEETFDME